MLNYFLKADDLNPGNPFVLFSIGQTYYSMNNCEKAVVYFNRIKHDHGLGESNRETVLKYLRQCGE